MTIIQFLETIVAKNKRMKNDRKFELSCIPCRKPVTDVQTLYKSPHGLLYSTDLVWALSRYLNRWQSLVIFNTTFDCMMAVLAAYQKPYIYLLSNGDLINSILTKISIMNDLVSNVIDVDMIIVCSGKINTFDDPMNNSQPLSISFYNMVYSALFLQRALYTVHCTIQCTLESRRLWSPSPFLVDTVNRYFVIYAAMKYATSYWNNYIWLPWTYTLLNIRVLGLVHKEIEISSSTDP